MSDKFITKAALAQAFKLIDETYVAKAEGKVLSSNDFTNAEKEKLAALQNAECLIEAIKVNGVVQDVVEKAVDIAVPELSKENIIAALGFTPITENEVKAEVADAVSKVNTLTYKAVAELPSIAEAEEATIYLVPNGTEEQNIYVEYIAVGDKWEKLGDTRLDLSEYAKTAEVTAAIAEAKEEIEAEAVTEEKVMEIATSDEAVEVIADKLPILSVSAIETIFRAVQNKTTLVQKNDGTIVEYATAEEAIQNAEEGETVTIHSNVEVSSAIEVADGVTIDLNGFTMSVA